MKKHLDVIEKICDGRYNVFVTGGAATGKKTFINAMLGAKVLPEVSDICTSFLTKIKYCEDDLVTIYSKDVNENGIHILKKPQTISGCDFFKEYAFRPDDFKELEEMRTINRYGSVQYIELNCKNKLLENDVRVIYSPYKYYNWTTDFEIEEGVIQNAQVIIYVCNCQLSMYDKEYLEWISRLYLNHLDNVFILINKIDQVTKNDRIRAVERIKQDITSIFTRADSTIHKDLCDRRVFAISAFQCLDARRGVTYEMDIEEDVILNDEKRKLMLEKSGYLQLKKELDTSVS